MSGQPAPPHVALPVGEMGDTEPEGRPLPRFSRLAGETGEGAWDPGVVSEDINALEGTTWVLTEIRDADGSWPLPGGIRSTMEIADGHLHVEAGCNMGHASVSVHDDMFQVGPMALTRMMCPDLAMKVEAAVTSVLQGQVPYLLSADVLAVGTAARLLVYRSDLPPAA